MNGCSKFFKLKVSDFVPSICTCVPLAARSEEGFFVSGVYEVGKIE